MVCEDYDCHNSDITYDVPYVMTLWRPESGSSPRVNPLTNAVKVWSIGAWSKEVFSKYGGLFFSLKLLQKIKSWISYFGTRLAIPVVHSRYLRYFHETAGAEVVIDGPLPPPESAS